MDLKTIASMTGEELDRVLEEHGFSFVPGTEPDDVLAVALGRKAYWAAWDTIVQNMRLATHPKDASVIGIVAACAAYHRIRRQAEMVPEAKAMFEHLDAVLRDSPLKTLVSL